MAGFVALGPVDRTVYRVGTLGRTYVTSLKKALRKRVSHIMSLFPRIFLPLLSNETEDLLVGPII